MPEYADYEKKSEESYPLADLIRHLIGGHHLPSQSIISTVYHVNSLPVNGKCSSEICNFLEYILKLKVTKNEFMKFP